MVTIYTDGSWKSQIAAGGWACMVVDHDTWKVMAEGAWDTTISRMELTAVLRGLASLTRPEQVVIVSDSQYTVNTINVWIWQWAMRHWRRSGSKPIANLDILKEIFRYMQIHQVTARWVKSHTKKKSPDYKGNDIVDWFAQRGSDTMANIAKNL